MMSWGSLDALEQMNHFSSTSPMFVRALLWVCCVSLSLAVVWKWPEWLSSLLTWKEGWLCNELSKLPQNSADNLHSSPSLLVSHITHSLRACLARESRAGFSFALLSPPIFSPASCASVHEQSIAAIPSATQLITALCKGKKTNESRTGYTREKHYITSGLHLFIEGTESFFLIFRLWCIRKTQLHLAWPFRFRRTWNLLNCFLWKAHCECETLCACLCKRVDCASLVALGTV